MNTNFFECLDTSSQSANIWNKFDPSMRGEVLFEGRLKKHSKTERDDLAERYFILQRDYLLYKKNEKENSISSAMKITYAKFVLPGKDDTDQTPSSMIKGPYPIKICFKNKYSLLYALNETEYNQWIAAFTKVLLRSDFHSRFTVAKIIGSGAFANVYEATEKTSGKKFAVKGFNKDYLEHDPKGKLALWNEIYVLRRMEHENLLRLYEVHETKNSAYLVFDIYEGGELIKFVETKKKLTEETIVKILIGLLRGLEYMADKNYAHRDLKPSNIMLRKTTDVTVHDVVIVDFGLAAAFDDQNLIYKRCGTPGYIAPEVIAAKNVEQYYKIPVKSDMFSIGVILYVLCAGKSPFEKPEWDVDTIIKKNMEAKVEFPSSIFGQYSPDLLKLLKGLMAADPKNRLTAREALSSTLCGGQKLSSELVDEFDEHFEHGAKEVYSSIGSIKSFIKRPAQASEDVRVSNNSIAVNSKGFLENTQNDGKKKMPAQSLYKKSLMKGVQSSKGSRASSKDRSVDNSPAHSFVGGSKASSRDSSDDSSDESNDMKKNSPENFHRRQSQFGPRG
jgi:serine/threonine protein kinase